MKLVREHINEDFDTHYNPMHNLGIGDKKTLIIEKINAISFKYGFKKWPVRMHGHITLMHGGPHFKIIKSWFSPNVKGGTWVHLMYDHHKRHNYYIEIEDEYGESGAEKIDYPYHPVFTEKWWKKLSQS